MAHLDVLFSSKGPGKIERCQENQQLIVSLFLCFDSVKSADCKKHNLFLSVKYNKLISLQEPLYLLKV